MVLQIPENQTKNDYKFVLNNRFSCLQLSEF